MKNAMKLVLACATLVLLLPAFAASEPTLQPDDSFIGGLQFGVEEDLAIINADQPSVVVAAARQGLVGEWLFEEGPVDGLVTGPVIDSSGHDNHGEPTGIGPTYRDGT